MKTFTTLYKEYADMYGLADKEDTQSADVDANELKVGMDIEKEHTRDPNVAKQIALDHLSEDPKYYTKLQQANL